MSLKNKLSGYSTDRTRWEKVTYREEKTNISRMVAIRNKKSQVYLDASAFRHVIDNVSPTARKVACTMLDVCEFGTNFCHMTYTEIEKECGFCKNSVTNSMVELQEADFIRRVRNGKWMINPAVATKCFQEDINRLMAQFSDLSVFVPKKNRVAATAEK